MISQRDGRLGPRTYDAKAPANYVAGLGRGAAGFTTQMDLGPAQAKDLEVADIHGRRVDRRGGRGVPLPLAVPQARFVSSTRSSGQHLPVVPHASRNERPNPRPHSQPAAARHVPSPRPVTLPRHYLSRGVYAVSRRCLERKFLLKPTKKATGPSYFDLIKSAIVALKERGGSSRQAINKFVSAKKGAGFKSGVFNKALKTAVEAKKLVQVLSSK